MEFPRKPTLLGRIMDNIRYQSRYGYEQFFIPVASVAVVATGALIWWLLAE